MVIVAKEVIGQYPVRQPRISRAYGFVRIESQVKPLSSFQQQAHVRYNNPHQTSG